MHGSLPRDAHNFPCRNGMRTGTKRPQTLAFSNVVVRMACATMESPSRQSDVGSKGMKLLETVRRHVEPAATVLRDFSVVDVYQLPSP